MPPLLLPSAAASCAMRPARVSGDHALYMALSSCILQYIHLVTRTPRANSVDRWHCQLARSSERAAMEWFTSSLQAAQQAATSLVGSDVAEKARQLAEEARQKAAAFAQEASIKAQVGYSTSSHRSVRCGPRHVPAATRTCAHANRSTCGCALLRSESAHSALFEQASMPAPTCMPTAAAGGGQGGHVGSGAQHQGAGCSGAGALSN